MSQSSYAWFTVLKRQYSDGMPWRANSCCNWIAYEHGVTTDRSEGDRMSAAAVSAVARASSWGGLASGASVGTCANLCVFVWGHAKSRSKKACHAYNRYDRYNRATHCWNCDVVCWRLMTAWPNTSYRRLHNEMGLMRVAESASMSNCVVPGPIITNDGDWNASQSN